MTAHREELKKYLADIHLKDVSVIDWGAGSKPASRYIQSDNCTFFTIDKNDSNPQDLIADICEPIFTGKADVAFCLEVIEHVERPEALLQNIYHNLKDSGVLYMSVPFQFEIHSTEDYWRFTENGIRLLLTRWEFKVIKIAPFDDNSGYFVKATR